MTDGDYRSLLAEAAGSLDLAPGPLTVEGTPDGLPSRLPAGDMAVACVATALTAAAGLQCQRGGARPRVRLDATHVTAAMRSERHLLVNGRGFGSGFAPLSRFWRAADGWVRTHGNYPWHRDALLRALGTADDPAHLRPGPACLGSSGEHRRTTVRFAVVRPTASTVASGGRLAQAGRVYRSLPAVALWRLCAGTACT